MNGLIAFHFRIKEKKRTPYKVIGRKNERPEKIIHRRVL